MTDTGLSLQLSNLDRVLREHGLCYRDIVPEVEAAIAAAREEERKKVLAEVQAEGEEYAAKYASEPIGEAWPSLWEWIKPEDIKP